MVNLPLLIPPSVDELIIWHRRQIKSHHQGLHPNSRPTKGWQPPRSTKSPPSNMSLDSPRQLEIWKIHRPRTSRRGLQEPTQGNGLVRRGRHPPQKISPIGHERDQSVGAMKSTGALENPLWQSIPHPHHEARMPSLHPTRLWGGTLYLPTRRRNLIQNGVSARDPRPFCQRN